MKIQKDNVTQLGLKVLTVILEEQKKIARQNCILLDKRSKIHTAIQLSAMSNNFKGLKLSW